MYATRDYNNPVTGTNAKNTSAMIRLCKMHPETVLIPVLDQGPEPHDVHQMILGHHCQLVHFLQESVLVLIVQLVPI